MQLHDWALIVGMIVNLFVVVKLAFGMGKWHGEINTKISDIVNRLDNFDKRYGNLPERVAFLEGIINGGKNELN